MHPPSPLHPDLFVDFVEPARDGVSAVHQQRRRLLLALSMGTLCLASCGGSGAQDSTPAPQAGQGPTPAPTPPSPPPAGSPPSSPAPAPVPTPAPPPAPAPTGARQFTLVSPNAGTAVPYTIGFPFREGDIPNGQSIAASTGTLQATVKNRWPDGSVKFAILAGRANLTAGAALTVALSATATAPGGAALSTADLRNTGVTASISCGAFGTASWSGTDWDSPDRTWVSGPEMSSWTYRRQVGSDAHLVAWLEVRLHAGGAVEVLPWVENGYVRVAGPSAKAATYVFTLSGTQRFSAAITLLNHQRTPLLSGSALSYWVGADPLVTVKHDTSYFQATRLVPGYWANVLPSAGVVAGQPGGSSGQPTTFTPLQQGSFPNGIGTGGYSPSIGLLPEWDVLYLTCTASTLWASAQRNGYSAGRYGIHFRDENTQRPIRFSSYPNLCVDGSTAGISSYGASSTGDVTPAATGGVPPNYTNSHAPAMGFMAYLMTGRVFHLETVQFQATLNFLKNPNLQRNLTNGVFRTDSGANTTRGAAWALRTLAQACAITPDGDTLQTEFVASLTANINFYHATYIAQPNNPFGFVKPYGDYTQPVNGVGDNIFYEAAWMQDFFTAAIGYAKSLKLPITSTTATNLDAFFTWKARSIVARFGGAGANEFLYRDAAPYVLSVSPSDNPDFDNGTGPWYADWGQIYTNTYSNSAVIGPNGPNGQTTPSPRADGDLRGSYFPDATAYWGNLQPALAYAVEYGVPGASLAYARMTGAANWNQLRDWFNIEPVWSVRPR